MIIYIIILFFASLLSIVFMVGRKIVLIKSGRAVVQEEIPFEIPYFKEARHFAFEYLKKIEHLSLVLLLRLYFRFANFIKYAYGAVKNKLKNLGKKSHIIIEQPEASKFLKMVSDYKHRVREIKHKIKEEEEKEL